MYSSGTMASVSATIAVWCTLMPSMPAVRSPRVTQTPLPQRSSEQLTLHQCQPHLQHLTAVFSIGSSRMQAKGAGRSRHAAFPSARGGVTSPFPSSH